LTHNQGVEGSSPSGPTGNQGVTAFSVVTPFCLPTFCPKTVSKSQFGFL